MHLIFLFLFVFVSVVIFTEEIEIENNQQKDLNVKQKQIISLHGYPLETHHVVTEDGYILELHRIPYGRSNVHTDHKPVVLIVHGLYGSSADWVTFGSNRSLAMILADNDYDVWLCNTRGSTWSEKHVKFDSKRDSNKFWNFSFQEIGNFDLPASIDYILSKTKQKKLHYIGQSQGTVVYFAMLSERPDYNNKIRLMISLAAPESITNLRLALRSISYTFMDDYQKLGGSNDLYYGVMQHSGSISKLLKLLCVNKSFLTKGLCASIYFSMGGSSLTQLNTADLPLIFKNIPAGGSNKQYLHLSQVRSDDFHKYDYGKIINKQIYGQEIPPSYNISKITTPVALYSGSQDIYLSSKQYLAKNLPNVVANKIIPSFGHFDFLWGRDAATLVYNDILAVMKKY